MLRHQLPGQYYRRGTPMKYAALAATFLLATTGRQASPRDANCLFSLPRECTRPTRDPPRNRAWDDYSQAQGRALLIEINTPALRDRAKRLHPLPIRQTNAGNVIAARAPLGK